MSFIWPVMLFSLLLVPLFAFLYVRMFQRRKKLVKSRGSFGSMQGAPGESPGLGRHLPMSLFLFGLAVMLFALARPQAVMSLPRIEGTVILAFDVSGSMAAVDMEPSRMEAAKAAARAFVDQQPSTVQVGVVAFSDGGFAVQAPTDDREAVFASIDRLAPERGTSLANGILVSLNTILVDLGQSPLLEDSSLTPIPDVTPTPLPRGTYAPAVIVLLTDGENNMDPDPFEAAQTARDYGVRVNTIGIGSPAGVTMMINGFNVHTQLDEAALQQISLITDGVYYNAQNEEELRSVYENLDPQLVVRTEAIEITSVLAAFSILVMLVGGALSLFWFGRVP